jgi:hypothetical protein
MTLGSVSFDIAGGGARICYGNPCEGEFRDLNSGFPL